MAFSFSPLTTAIDGPRTAELLLRNGNLKINTPGILACTSRGIVPHLSRDNLKRTSAIKWVHVPFETFLEHQPPIPTLQPQHGDSPRINSFLGLSEDNYVVSVSLRDPADGREMPANTNAHVTANCIRGVRKVTPNDWRSYIHSLSPDIAFSLSDNPYTPPPYSQKRLTKSIERSALWLADLLASRSNTNIFVQMAGGASIPARKAFSESLVEAVHGKEADAIRPLKSLDEGVAGYVFDMVSLRLASQGVLPAPSPLSLLQASLSSLPSSKPRLVTSAWGPHEMLRLILDVGVDLFDTQWAQKAADIGVALDFAFPVQDSNLNSRGLLDLGHNLYDPTYQRDFTPLSSSSSICACASCSPYSIPTSEVIRHSSIDGLSSVEIASSLSSPPSLSRNQPYTKAYLHHLLHTHEMSAHTLLAMHNITVMEAFFTGVRETITASIVGSSNAHSASITKSCFEAEVSRFFETYAEDDTYSHAGVESDSNASVDTQHPLNVFKAGRKAWEEVELLRGKGRLARESEKEKASSLSDLPAETITMPTTSSTVTAIGNAMANAVRSAGGEGELEDVAIAIEKANQASVANANEVLRKEMEEKGVEAGAESVVGQVI